MILVLGAPDDNDAASVHAELCRRGVPVARFDAHALSGIGAVSLVLSGGGRLDGVVSASGDDVYTEDVCAVWLGRRGAIAGYDLLDDLWDMIDAPTIPATPMSTERASNKARQRKLAEAAGFVVCPESSDAATLRETKVNIVATVVGQSVFSAAVETMQHEHADGQNVDVRESRIARAPYILPSTEVQRCVDLVRALDLEYATIDLAVTSDNRLVFLDLSPRGQYGWIEDETGLPITRAIVDLLMVRAHRSGELLGEVSYLHSGMWSLPSSAKTHPTVFSRR